MPIISSKSKVLLTLSTSLSFLSSIGRNSVIARRMRLGLPRIEVQMAATCHKKKGSAAVHSSVATDASGYQRRAQRSLNLGGASSSSLMDRNLRGNGRLVT